jgi:hypothetical protein
MINTRCDFSLFVVLIHDHAEFGPRAFGYVARSFSPASSYQAVRANSSLTLRQRQTRQPYPGTPSSLTLRPLWSGHLYLAPTGCNLGAPQPSNPNCSASTAIGSRSIRYVWVEWIRYRLGSKGSQPVASWPPRRRRSAAPGPWAVDHAIRGVQRAPSPEEIAPSRHRADFKKSAASGGGGGGGGGPRRSRNAVTPTGLRRRQD